MYSTALSGLPKHSTLTALSVSVRTILSCVPTASGLLRGARCPPGRLYRLRFCRRPSHYQSHLGLFAELTTADALRRAAAATQEKLYIEHVTIYLYTHPEAFSVRLLPLPDELEGRLDLRFTLDTMEDFTLLQELYAAFCEQTDHSIHALLRLVEAHPEYRAKMLENIAKNEK